MKKSILLVLLAMLMLICSCSGSTTNIGNGDRQIAVTVGTKEIDNVEMLYQYNEAIGNFYNANYNLVSLLGIDFSGDLSEQYISETQTWRDYFIESAMYAIMEENYLILAAEDAGFELDAQQLADVEASLTNFYSQLSAYGYEVEPYLRDNYGADITVEDFESYVMKDAVSFYYYQEILKSIPVDDAALNEFYESNSRDFDSVDFKVYHFAYTVPETEDGSVPEDESYKNEAKAAAEAALASITTPEEFEPYVKSTLNDEELASWPDGYTDATATYAEIFEELANWLFDDSRVSGDKTIIEYNSGYFITMFEDRYLDSYNTVDVRHCLVATSTVSNILVEGSDEIDYEATQAAQEASDAAAYAEAERLLNEWIAGGATEEAFAAMADTNSDDGAEGGLYTQILKGEMVQEFEDWCFDETRTVGDYGIVKTDYGYHIMYFSAENEAYWKLTAIDTLRQAGYDEAYEDFAEKYPVIKNESVLANIK